MPFVDSPLVDSAGQSWHIDDSHRIDVTSLNVAINEPPEWRERYAEHRCTFDRVINETNPRLIVRELPPLDRATNAQLSRTMPNYDAKLRRNHYEQVGQYIAEAAIMACGRFIPARVGNTCCGL